MEEIQLDYATLVSVYQTKINDLSNQVILLEAKNLIMSKKLQELLNNDSSEVKASSSRSKKGLDKPSDDSTY
jgi:hypothetical protein